MVVDKKSRVLEMDDVQRQEFKFRAEARRNKLLGLWAGAEMGLSADACEAYAKEVVRADMEEPGDADVVGKVLKDLAEGRVAMTEDDLRRKLDTFMELALDQVAEEIAAKGD